MQDSSSAASLQIPLQLLRQYVSDATTLIRQRSNEARLQELMDEAGMSSTTGQPAQAASDFAAYFRLLHLARQHTDLADIAVRIGERRCFQEFGLFGLAMLAAGDIRTLAQLSARYFGIGYGVLTAQVAESDDWIIHSVQPSDPALSLGSAWQEQVLSCFAALMRQADPELNLDECEVYLGELGGWTPLRQAMPMRTHAAANMLEIRQPMRWGRRKLRQSDSRTARWLQDQCDAWLPTLVKSDVEDAVRALLRSMLWRGEPLQLDEVAHRLNRAPRTLRLQLARTNTSFRDLCNEARGESASQYLRETEMPIKRIASVLGYSDTGNFCRAFLRQFRLTPLQYRQRVGSACNHPSGRPTLTA